ncbi:VanZ family protein [Methylomonas koyamae]|uniref:VanZ family protein n=1 Tax=Methylomonas koyamae TaxID=702114 RepID=UPI0018D2F00D|nr:VanZ family protein [Methylomonas koyamae]
MTTDTRYVGLIILAAITVLFFATVPGFICRLNSDMDALEKCVKAKSWVLSRGNNVFEYDANTHKILLRSSSSQPAASLSCDINHSGLPRFLWVKTLALFNKEAQRTQVGGKARIILLSIDSNHKARYDYPHVLFSSDMNTNWNSFEKVFEIEPSAIQIRLSLELLNQRGVVAIKQLSLCPVEPNNAHTVIRRVLLLVWVLAIWFAMLPLLLEHNTGNRRLLIGVCVLLILAGVLVPEVFKVKLGSLFQTTALVDYHLNGLDIKRLVNFTFSLPSFDIFKIGHFLLFFALAVLDCSARENVTHFFFKIALFAMVTEVLQLFVQGRTPSVGDALVDTIGSLLGVVLVWVAFVRFYFWRS